MAITAVFVDNQLNTNLQAEVPGNRFEGFVEISFAAGDTYPTGGFSIATLVASLGLRLVTHFMPVCIGPAMLAIVNDFSYDKANGKVQFWANPAVPTETANAQNVSTIKLYAFVKGLR